MELSDSKDCDFGSEAVAVVMTAYNEREPWVRASIESILTQTHDNLHLYIALDDPHNQALKDLIGEYEASDERVSLLVNERNIGLVKSLNRLLDRVREPYVARMDADDVSYPDRLERELAFLHEYGLDFVMGGDDLISEEGTVTPGRVLPLYLPEDMPQVQKYANVSRHPTWLLKTSVYRDLGGYRDIDSCEDLDFVLRALQSGYRLGRMPDALVQYRLRDSGISHSKAVTQSAKAKLLRTIFRSGARLDAPGVEERVSGVEIELSPREGAKVDVATSAMDRFTTGLYERKWLQCVSVALPQIFVNRFFREMFFDAVFTRARIAKLGQR